MMVHNILITGGDHEDRVKYATQLLLSLLCLEPLQEHACESCSNCTRVLNQSHPNVIFVEPIATTGTKTDGIKANNGIIKIDQIREIVLENHKANFEKGNCVFVISHMHKATKAAANALLKVMEEHKNNKIFIALAPSRTAVLSTIASRMVCRPVIPNLHNYLVKNLVRQEQILTISKAHKSDRLAYCSQLSSDKNTLLTELEELSHECHVMLRSKEISPLFVLHVRIALERAVSDVTINLNPRLAIERLILREWPLLSN